MDEWQDRATMQKRRGTKIVAATLDRVRPFSMGGARPAAIPMVRAALLCVELGGHACVIQSSGLEDSFQKCT